MTDTLPVMIGWDQREAVAADVCRHSLLRHASIPLYVRFLKQEPLREIGLYRRQWEWRGGQRIDLIDERPFSTEFSFTRFLVPALCGYDGWALFCDCDFLFMADVAELLPFMDDSKAVLVCKQIHLPTETQKMDGCAQSQYRRKNWSSLMLLNCGHPSTRALHVRDVNERTGAFLHSFDWLDGGEIGELPPQWNYIAGTTTGTPKAVHLTSGGPWLPQCQDVAFAREWRDAYALACRKAMEEAA